MLCAAWICYNFLIKSEWIILSLLLFGFIVVVCGVLGAWINSHIIQEKWEI